MTVTTKPATEAAAADPVLHHRDGRPAPRWAVRIAHLIPLLTLPSGLWRIALVLGVPLGLRFEGTPVRLQSLGEAVYVVGLSVVAEAVALLSLGLVRPWGEQVPRWLRLVGGRRVPPLFAVTMATTGAVALILIWTFAMVNLLAGPGAKNFEFSGDWAQALLLACYLPNLLWGPLLLAVAWAYYRRRCRD
jgi:hypothetical protein